MCVCVCDMCVCLCVCAYVFSHLPNSCAIIIPFTFFYNFVLTDLQMNLAYSLMRRLPTKVSPFHQWAIPLNFLYNAAPLLSNCSKYSCSPSTTYKVAGDIDAWRSRKSGGQLHVNIHYQSPMIFGPFLHAIDTTSRIDTNYQGKDISRSNRMISIFWGQLDWTFCPGFTN